MKNFYHFSYRTLSYFIKNVLDSSFFPFFAEFSEALKELGTCLLKKTALDDNEESGKRISVFFACQINYKYLENKFNLKCYYKILVHNMIVKDRY